MRVVKIDVPCKTLTAERLRRIGDAFGVLGYGGRDIEIKTTETRATFTVRAVYES